MAATKVWDGSTWRDLQGPKGDAGPTVVSTDAGQLAKLGADGKLLVAQADLDTRYVNVAGDTMTGPLDVRASNNQDGVRLGVTGAITTIDVGSKNAAEGAGRISYNRTNGAVTVSTGTQASQTDRFSINAGGASVVGTFTSTGTITVRAAAGSPSYLNLTSENAAAIALLDSYGDTAASASSINFRRYRGTAAAPTTVAANDSLSSFVCTTRNAAGTNTFVSQTRVVAVANPVVGEAGIKTRMEFSVHSGAALVTPFQITDAGVSISGNITSTGTAHNFAANSIPASAVAARPPILPTAASYTLKLADANGTIINTTQNVTVSIIIPDNATVPFPIGTRFEVLDASAASTTIIQASAAVTLSWNSNLQAVGQGQSGGAGSIVSLPGPFSRCVLYKVGTDSWVVIS